MYIAYPQVVMDCNVMHMKTHTCAWLLHKQHAATPELLQLGDKPAPPCGSSLYCGIPCYTQIIDLSQLYRYTGPFARATWFF